MIKEEVQNRVSQNGEMLALDKFNWDEKTKVFSSTENNLVINFNNIDSCTFDTGYNCTFKTGSYCTFDTGSYCTFDTGSYCTFKTGSSCTFDTGSSCTFKTGSDCIVVRRDFFEFFSLKERIKTKLCPYKIKGYLEEHDGKFYLNGNIKGGEYVTFDNILSKVINKRGNIYKVINYNESKISYVVKEDEVTAHGKTIRECYDSLIYKRKDKDTSLYKTWKSSDIKTKEELIKAYRTITGACEYGVKSFCEKIELPKECSVEKAIEITCGHYGNNKFKDFFKE